jgi:hypothetical protein
MLYPRTASHAPVLQKPWIQAAAHTDSAKIADRLLLAGFLLVGFGLRLFLLQSFPFREDEAIYSYWALHLWQVDPLALQVWPDKPPLFLWILSAAFAGLGPSEAGARLVNIFASLLTIPVVAATARHLWGRTAGLITALVLALNPFAISFAATAYTDPLLVLWGSLSIHAAITGRGFWAGIWLGAAIMTKQQGLLYVPVVVGCWWLAGMRGGEEARRRRGEEAKRRRGEEAKRRRGEEAGMRGEGQDEISHTPPAIRNSQFASRITHHASRFTQHASRFTQHVSRFTHHASRFTHHASRFTHHASRFTHHASRITFHNLLITHYSLLITPLLGLSLTILPILYWDSLRWQVAPSPWDLSVRNYGGFALAPLADWPARLAGWGELLWYLAAHWAVWIALAGVGMRGCAEAWRRRGEEAKRRRGEEAKRRGGAEARRRGDAGRAFLLLLGGWAGGFLLFHLITTSQIWDRYLLPLAPVFALLVGYALSRIQGKRLPATVLLVVGLLMAPAALTAARGGFPIGGDHGDYSGLHEVVNWLDEHAPPQSPLYHRALGWHYRFYFFDREAPGQNRFDLRWYPHSIYLADNAAKVPHRRRFLVSPEWMPMPALERDLAVRQLRAEERFSAGRFTLYELVGPPQTYCDWCVCTGELEIGRSGD